MHTKNTKNVIVNWSTKKSITLIISVEWSSLDLFFLFIHLIYSLKHWIPPLIMSQCSTPLESVKGPTSPLSSSPLFTTVISIPHRSLNCGYWTRWIFRLNQCYFDYSNRIFQLCFLLCLLQMLNHYGVKKWYKKIPPHSLFLQIRYRVRVATLLLFILFLYLSMKPMITYLSMKPIITGVVTSFLSISLCFFAKNNHHELLGQVLTVSYEKMQFF